MSTQKPPHTVGKGTVRSLTHALLILERLAAEPEPLPLHELTARIGLPKSTVHRLLSTLRAHQFVLQDPPTGRYTIGPMAWVIGSHSPQVAQLHEAARKPLEHLRDATGEAVFVTLLSETRSLLVDFIGGLRAVTVARYGSPWAPAWATAAGRVALAYRSRAVTRAEIEDHAAVPGHEVLSSAQLTERFAEIRARGWEAECTSEATLEIAAPLRDHSARIVGAAGVVTPVRQGEQPPASLVAAVTVAAEQISGWLGYLPQPTALPSLP